ncbi:MAG: DUF2955 domain-containing protein [Thiohalocapsa sp.]
MPTEPSTETGLPESADDQASARRTWDRRALRLGLGVTLTFVIALAYDWTLAYLAPIFTAPLLQAPRAPTTRAAVGILLVTFLIMACAWSREACRKPTRRSF